MTCLSTTIGNQTEFEFFQQLRSNHDTPSCCGPLTTIGFTKPSMAVVHRSMERIGLPDGYLDNYSPELLDSSHMSLTMCPKHWILHARGIGKLAENTDDDVLHQLAYYIFRLVCLTNNWDYKEILNYASSVGTSKPD